MSQKTKYILSTIAGFLAILVIGVAAIKLMKAKRTTAPDVDQASMKDIMAKQTAPPQDAAAVVPPGKPVPMPLPAELTSAPAVFADIPLEVQQLVVGDGTGFTVYKVDYAGGLQGYRLERDKQVAFDADVQAWRSRVKGWRSANGQLSKDAYRMELYKGKVRVYAELNKLTETQTSEQIRVLIGTSDYR